jgi:hypothetical protein
MAQHAVDDIFKQRPPPESGREKKRKRHHISQSRP